MSDEITITLPDGSTRPLPAGATGADLAAAIGKGLAKAAVAAVVDGAEVDLTTPLPDGAAVSIVTTTSEEGRYVLRHSTAHVLAQAVTDLWPGAKYAIGPPIENGFYYDFDLPGGESFTDDDLGRIEARMREIIAADQPFERELHSIDEGLELFADQPYKVEIIKGVDDSEGAGDGVVSAYRNRPDWVDLCRGPHVARTSRLGAFKLQRVSAAYWRGDEHNQQLQRIYGTAWESEAALKAHLAMLEEAEKRDHRRLGAELDLFSLPSELGGGLVLWHPKGARVRRLIEDFSRAEHDAAGYELAFTPHIAKSVLWETSGHLDWYADGMYPPMELEGATYYPKPMNCPFHILIYRSHQHSYRELPFRVFELGTVYRYERSGVMHGLFRVRGFTQDDAHIFCTPEQLGDELSSLLAFVLRMLRTFGFTEFEAALATRPPGKSVGEDYEWERATDALRSAIDGAGLAYTLDEGGGAFYGPKIDVHIRDAIGRRWQLSTIQVDFQLPQRFELEFVGADNSRHRPIMIHRALFGSIERFFAILIEHFAGALPSWLAPVQVRVLPVSDEHGSYAGGIVDRLTADGFRVDLVPADETLSSRIRRGRLEKIPYVLVVGSDDVAAGTVGVNARGSERPVRDVPVEDFVGHLRAEVAQRADPSSPAVAIEQ
ncbi:MAG TPA: threonine--tRNA ligase [Acidimicrobiales bacterium]|nr:threonine--tRNA ligase [Acidimicrobiales bacterium]